MLGGICGEYKGVRLIGIVQDGRRAQGFRKFRESQLVLVCPAEGDFAAGQVVGGAAMLEKWGMNRR